MEEEKREHDLKMKTMESELEQVNMNICTKTDLLGLMFTLIY